MSITVHIGMFRPSPTLMGKALVDTADKLIAEKAVNKLTTKKDDAKNKNKTDNKKVTCKVCLDYRYLVGDLPADGINTGDVFRSCPKCNPKGKLFSKHNFGVKPYVR